MITFLTTYGNHLQPYVEGGWIISIVHLMQRNVWHYRKHIDAKLFKSPFHSLCT